MRILVAFFFLAAASDAVAPSSMELRNRYGVPNTETFTARPEIDVTVEYGSDRLVCDISIGAHRPLLYANPQPEPVSVQAVSEILDELVPMTSRGKQISGEGFLQTSSCNVFGFADYENVAINRTIGVCNLATNRDQEIGATVSFKRDACPKHPSMFKIVK